MLIILLDSKAQLLSGVVSFRAAEAGVILPQSDMKSGRELFSPQILQVWGAAGSGEG